MQLKLLYQIKKIYREITQRNQVIMLTSVNIFHNKSSLFPIDLHLNTDSHVPGTFFYRITQSKFYTQSGWSGAITGC